MPWTPDRWPPLPGHPLDAEAVFNEVRAALAERNALVPAGFVPAAFARWDPIRGTPAGGDPDPRPTVANFQFQVREMLALAWPLRWWDPNRETLYTLAALCQDAFGADAWTWDLTATDGQGEPVNPWTPACATVFAELYHAVNRLDRVRLLPTVSAGERRDSVYRLTFGISDWPEDRADTFSLFDGADDGVSCSLAYDVGMGAEVFDDGFSQQWFAESRRLALVFATGALAGCAVRQAWLDVTTEAPAGQADYADTFTAEVVDAAETVLDSFASDDYGAKRVAVPAASVNTAGDTVLAVRSARPDTADRPAWAPTGPNYTSTYREGLAVTGPVRLIVEVDFEYEA
jgi:hypothetical protein